MPERMAAAPEGVIDTIMSVSVCASGRRVCVRALSIKISHIEIHMPEGENMCVIIFSIIVHRLVDAFWANRCCGVLSSGV